MNIDKEWDENVVSKLTGVLNIFKSSFECMDLVFFELHILDPTDTEIKELRKAVQAFEKLWLDLDLNVTPKFQI